MENLGGECSRREPITELRTGIRFVWVCGGCFEMGDGKSLQAPPAHRVQVSPFWLGETPVTNAQYEVFLKERDAQEPAFWRDPKTGNRHPRFCSSPEQPVVGVNWDEAQAFCRWLEKIWGRAVMLPSEAQWEFAARGVDGLIYPWGNEPPPDATRACFGLDPKTGQPAPVDDSTRAAGRGPFGTLDQAGNVWEWCQDAEDSARILRGGGWSDPALNLRAASRLPRHARGRDDDFGFRVAAKPASP
jgi:formylglycine-generating enzyme required for sulfatase activity